ncbi:MAG TPA: ROK family protein [Acidisoma sp.]|uniref:ROK family protein n=1 Tax=Acidisoma sp. TaxID=1872115 RepID=UPI002BEB5D1B|nr:ROK family protein [Acidisoma sp.]HTI01595.1 ROK family protein [Acidisoma sp.]
MRYAIGVDIGGTSTKLGLVSEQGEIAARRVIALRPDASFADFADELGDGVAALLGNGIPVAGIGVGIPGYAHPETGAIVKPVPNCPPLAGGSLAEAFSKRFAIPTKVGNDGVCAAMGERDFGAGRAFRRYCVLTLGTGIGGAVVIDGVVIDGPYGLPPEIGAICLDPSRTDLPSNVPGTFEFLASAASLVRRYQALAPEADVANAKELFTRAESGDALARQVVQEGGRWIAQAVGMMSNMLNLDAVILGGGLSHAGSQLLDCVTPFLDGFYWAPFGRPPQLLLAATGNDAGIVGAAALGLQFSGVHV